MILPIIPYYSEIPPVLRVVFHFLSHPSENSVTITEFFDTLFDIRPDCRANSEIASHILAVAVNGTVFINIDTFTVTINTD